MQTPLVKQITTTAQLSLQPNMATLPMTVNSDTAEVTHNVTALNKTRGKNVVVTTQNLSTGHPIIPNMQILNMRPGAPTIFTQKSAAAVSPRVVMTRPGVPCLTLQTLQNLQSGQQGHLLLKTENGQYQLLRVGPTPASSTLAVPPSQTIRLSTVPAHPGIATVSTSAAQVVMAGSSQMPEVAPMLQASITSGPTPVTPQPQPQSSALVNTKEKCRNFLANLLDLSSKEPQSVEISVRNLIQELIDSQVEPEEFCERLERLLNASPQPCLIGFLKKSLPLLRQSLVSKDLVIEGIKPPAPNLAFLPLPQPTTQNTVAVTNVQIKPASKTVTSEKVAVLQNIPIHTKINVNKVSSGKSKNTLQWCGVPSAALSTVLTPDKSLLKNKEKNLASAQFSLPQYSDDKMAGDDDINDVAAMGGVNILEETQQILGSTNMIGAQIRSCKEEHLVPLNAMQMRVKAIALKHGLEEPTEQVASLMSHAVHERLKTFVEKLAVIAQHRIDHDIKTDDRYEPTQDVKGQLKFLEELDRVGKKRHDDIEREILLRAAKSRSKNEDSEQAKLKAKAKEMQRVELEELRHREANLTALQAIGSKKKPRLDGLPGDSLNINNSVTGTGFTGRSQLPLRARMKRVNLRDMIFLLEQDRETSHSTLLYKSYLK